jgi:hypothetical protein
MDSGYFIESHGLIRIGFNPVRSNLAAHLDPHNEGVLIVSLRGGDRSEQGVDFRYP